MIWTDEEEENENDKSKGEEEEEKEDKKVKEKEKEKEKESVHKSERDEDESESDSRKIRSPKEKIIELLKDKYQSIKNGIKNNTYKVVHENFDELMKNNDKINSIFKKEEIPSYYYECFALIEDITSISKDEQKKLSKENNNSLSSLKKNQVRYLKKIGPAYSEYKKNRKNDEELEKDLENILNKQKKTYEESDDEDDILELMKRDENKEPAQRRLKWVKKEKVKEEKVKEEKDGGKRIKQIKNTENKVYDESDDEKKIEEVLSQKDIEKEYEQFSKQRGQNKSPLDVVQRLEYLQSKTTNELLQIKLLTLSNLICFDNYTNQLSAFPLSLWDKVYKDIETLIGLHDNLKKEKTEQNKDIENMSLILQNNLSTMMEKLENELYKSLQFNTINNNEYINSLLNEIKYLKLCKKAEIFYSNLNNKNGIARIY